MCGRLQVQVLLGTYIKEVEKMKQKNNLKALRMSELECEIEKVRIMHSQDIRKHHKSLEMYEERVCYLKRLDREYERRTGVEYQC